MIIMPSWMHPPNLISIFDEKLVWKFVETLEMYEKTDRRSIGWAGRQLFANTYIDNTCRKFQSIHLQVQASNIPQTSQDNIQF